MAAMGQSGTNSHPGLSFNSIRRSYPQPHPNPNNKPSPAQPQHASPYQPQPTYAPQNTPQAYPHHLFQSTPTSVPSVQSVQSVPNVPNVNNLASVSPVPNANPRTAQAQVAAASRRAPSRQQMAQQPPTSMAYQQIMNQPLQQVGPVQQSDTPSIMQQQPQQMGQSLSQQQQQLQHHQQHQQQHQHQQHPQHQQHQPVQQMQPQVPQIQQVNQPPQVQQQPPQQVQQVQQQPQIPQVQQVPQTQQPSQVQQLQQAPQVQQVQQPQQVSQVQPQQTPQVQQLPQVQQPHTQAPQDDAVAAVQHPDEMEVDSSQEDGDPSLEPKLLEGTPFVPRQPMGTMMSAPPEGGSYPTLEAVHKAVLQYCTSVGYAIVIGRSKKTVPGLKKVLFVCDRAGKPPTRVSPEMRKRKTSSRKCDCQFGFFAIEQRTQWTVRYRPDPIHLEHNHGPSESPLLHPAARKLDSKMVAAVKQLKDSGVGVSQTLEILQSENPHVPLLPRDIYNARAAINRNPQKVASGIAENRPAIYSKPHPTAEERIRADLRREIAKAREELEQVQKESQKKIEELQEKLREKDKVIEKFEMFIDICNQRVMVQRERLAEDGGQAGSGSNP